MHRHTHTHMHRHTHTHAQTHTHTCTDRQTDIESLSINAFNTCTVPCDFHDVYQVNNRDTTKHAHVRVRARHKQTYFYRPQHTCGKVIFSQASVSHSVHGGRCVSNMHWGRHPPGQTPPCPVYAGIHTYTSRRPLLRTVRILL